MSLVLISCNFSEITPTLLSNFKTLRRLRMIGCNLPRLVLHAVGNLIGLQTLEMDSCTTDSSMPSSIGNLTNLRTLYIRGCEFSGPMPAAIGKLTGLRKIGIESTGFSGPVPTAIGNLTNLINMYIIDCGFLGLPAAIGNLTYLKIQDLQSFGSSIPYAIGQLSELEWLDLSLNDFSGSIPSSIGNLTQLKMLDLSFNSLTGEIPSSIFSLPILNQLDLSYNQLSGKIRGFDKADSQLETLSLGNNALSGFIPKAFFQLTSLVYIDVSSNNLIGSVDLAHFWRLSDLASLHLSYNKLHVMDADDSNPVDTTYLTGLNELGLASCNMTRFPWFLRHITRISYLDLSCNKISGDVPNWVWGPAWNNFGESYLNLSHNMFTGLQLNSDVLPYNGLMHALDLMYPIIVNGHVPPSICNAKNLGVLDLSYNNFSGPIPSCLIENVPLNVLNLRENHFKGTLPSNITIRCSLQTIDLHGNNIEGKLPRGLSNCIDLEVLDFGGNRIADTFPSWLRGLPKLSILVLRSNQLYGTIGVGDTKSEECFPSLQVIDLASNNFSGNLRLPWLKRLKSMMAAFNSSGKTLSPLNTTYAEQLYYQYSIDIMYKGTDMQFGRMLTTVTAMDFSNNRLEGTIPETFGALVSLRVLNLSHNAFTGDIPAQIFLNERHEKVPGDIPAQIGRMTDLESLDLSCNQLSGEISEELTKLTFLGILNLSNNQLVGKIPESGQFSTFDNSSFEGNIGLCGLQLPKSPCGVSPHTPSVAHVNKASHHFDVILFLFVGLGFGVGFAAAIVVKCSRIGKCFIATARASPTWSPSDR
ncbi:hypothetical protein U9M48_040990 [Paspalum notatum var. saurae]|uniref:Disease resistance R13L4/SHOC-2-like LRR domain-containing protein n=1 Tax=Paspalum notatum var. saurae TaxID=547442 RepID=A0AAQ3UPE5_PASNO